MKLMLDLVRRHKRVAACSSAAACSGPSSLTRVRWASAKAAPSPYWPASHCSFWISLSGKTEPASGSVYRSSRASFMQVPVSSNPLSNAH